MRSFRLLAVLIGSLCLTTVFHLESALADEGFPSCTNYTKNDYGPETIDSQAICEDACRSSEGLNVGDYNTNDDGSYHQCDCKSVDNSGNAKETRTICKDGSASGGVSICGAKAATGITVGLALAASLVGGFFG